MQDTTTTTRVESHECATCGSKHERTVSVYRFPTVGRELGTITQSGPVSLVIDEYGDWHADVDSETIVDQYWDSEAKEIVIEVQNE